MDVRLDHKEGWENWWFWIMVLEMILESPLNYKEIKLVSPKGNRSWVFAGRTDAEAESPIFWPSDQKSHLIGKNPDAWKDWGQEEKAATEDETVEWHHQFNGRELKQTRRVWWQRVRNDWVTEQQQKVTRKDKWNGNKYDSLFTSSKVTGLSNE